MPHKNREQRLLYLKQWRLNNTEKVKQDKIQYYTNNAEVIGQANAQYRKELKIAVFTHYGLKCALCQESRLGALHIDHINNNGNEHRKFIASGNQFYLWLKRNDFPPDFRTLCANCNWKEYMKSRPPLSATKNATAIREQRTQIKLGIMIVLGGMCTECGCSDLEILTVQHTNNNGAEHRQIISTGIAGDAFYRATLQSDDFTGLECLCFSCNDNATYSR